MTSPERLETIADILRRERIATQEDLRQRLEREGFDITQATLSRDLARLGARRVPSPAGGTYYELPESPAVRLAQFKGLVRRVQENGSLVVMHTLAGAASAVAAAIDSAQLDDVLGSIAGDDTVFIAPARAASTARVARKLKALFGLEEPSAPAAHAGGRHL